VRAGLEFNQCVKKAAHVTPFPSTGSESVEADRYLVVTPVGQDRQQLLEELAADNHRDSRTGSDGSMHCEGYKDLKIRGLILERVYVCGFLQS
jgi:hypothetical protein